MENELLNEFNFGDKSLSLKEQAALVDDLLFTQVELLQKSFPKLKLSYSGSVRYNSLRCKSVLSSEAW